MMPGDTIRVVCLAMLTLAGCATPGSSRPNLCEATAEGYGSPVEWRALALPGCGSQFVTQGGSNPQLPSVRFPITDEATIREHFDCLEPDVLVAVDFATERVEEIDVGFGADAISWVARAPEELVVHKTTPTYCGGITPERYSELIVVPREAPSAIRYIACGTGTPCSGPPRP